jgi:hypothetical protein
MKRHPEPPALNRAGELTGHLWIQERPTGGQFRFQVAASGLITFGMADRTVETVDAVPLPYRRAAETVSECLDRGALHAATEDPAQVTFLGLATRNEGVDYDWTALPAFVGVDVWSGDAFAPPDAATRVFEELGLDALPAVEKELSAAHATLDRYHDAVEFPASVWRDGAAAAVLVRDKTGGRARAWRPGVCEREPDPATESPTELAAMHATDERIERTVTELRESGESPTVDAVRDRLVANVVREAYATLCPGDEFVASAPDFESAVAERVQRYTQQTSE